MLETPAKQTSYVLLTFDIEDWFQVENFKKCIALSSWPDRELRVEKNTHRILDLLDSIPVTGYEAPESRVRATFFVLGWIAQRIPQLVREVRSRGHEVASHGFYHNLCHEEPPEELRRDLEDSKKLLEDLIGAPVDGYRAPSFSVSSVILKTVEACGYLYDSSFNSFGLHDRYGRLDLSGHKRHGIATKLSKSFYELPISNLELGPWVVPWGGGGYFRIIPFPLFKLGARWVLRQKGAYLFYLHPWELDPDQPRVFNAPWAYRFRHYVNLTKGARRISKLAEYFRNCKFITCRQYLERVTAGNDIEVAL